MRIGMTDSIYEKLYGEKKYELMKRHGWDCVDYQGFLDTETPLFALSGGAFDDAMKRERELADRAGMTIWQVHGPWRYPPRDASPEDRAERLAVMKRTIRAAALLGCSNWVIHPMMPFAPGKAQDEAVVREVNRQFFGELLACAHESGVTIQLENMPFPWLCISAPEEILAFVREMNDDALRICLDTGHSAVYHIQPADAMRKLGSLVQTLHVHDNDGVRDRHSIPYTGWIDWEDFSAALTEVGFDGVLSFEAGVGKLPPAAAEYMLRAFVEAARVIARR